MILSDQQMNAVTGPGVGAWEEVARPVGPQPLPEWVKGAAADWGYGYANAPTVRVKVAGEVYDWPQQRWAKEGEKTYIARHADGRAMVHYHNGAVIERGAWREVEDGKPITAGWVVEDAVANETPRQAAQRGWERHVRLCTWLSLEEQSARRAEFKVVRATALQGGYGGSNYPLVMEDGSELILRGPWHGGAPEGYVEVTTFDCTDPFYAAHWRGPPWHRRGGRGALYLTEDLWLRIVARYIPHAPALRVHHSYGVRLELSQAGWNGPKAQAYRAEQQRAINKQPASPNWRLFWDGRGGYSGSLRTPTYGFEPGVDPTPPRRFWE